MQKKRYAVCGVSSRAIGMYVGPMLREFSHCSELVALLDIDPLRFQVCKDQVPEAKDVPEYLAADFDKMMADYAEPEKWTKKSLVNIAGAGYFAADRSIKDYADKAPRFRS